MLAVDGTSSPLAPRLWVAGPMGAVLGRRRRQEAQSCAGKMESYSVGLPEEACSNSFIFSQ